MKSLEQITLVSDILVLNPTSKRFKWIYFYILNENMFNPAVQLDFLIQILNHFKLKNFWCYKSNYTLYLGIISPNIGSNFHYNVEGENIEKNEVEENIEINVEGENNEKKWFGCINWYN